MIFALAYTLAMTMLQPGDAANGLGRAKPPKSNLPACSFPGGATLIKRKADLPAQVNAELDRLFRPANGLADAGQFFESTDIRMSNAPTARFIRAYHVRRIYIIWFERGGIALSSYTIALVPAIDQPTGRTVFRAAGGSSFQGDLCAASKAFIAGARSGG